jgi:hypothetical protein
MIVGPITVRSACSHHLCPVIGKIWIGVMPNEHTNVIGLSKYARLADWIMGRPQIQEEAVVQLADLIQHKTQPDGLALVMEASHFCMSWRGVGHGQQDDELRHARRVPEGRQPAPRIPVPHSPGSLRPCWYACFTPAARWTTPSRPCKPFRIGPAPQPGQRRDRHPGVWRRRVHAGHRGRPPGGERPVRHHLRDARHKDVVLLHYEEIVERRFGGWTMGLVDVSRVNASVLLKYPSAPSSTPTPSPARCRWPCSTS